MPNIKSAIKRVSVIETKTLKSSKSVVTIKETL